MGAQSVEERILRLCRLFNGRASIGYNENGLGWYVVVEGAYLCTETGSTMRRRDGTVENLLAASSPLSGYGSTIESAVEKIEKQTIKCDTGFVVSNQPFGLFSGGCDDETPVITVYEGTNPINKFDFDATKLRAALRRYSP